MTYSITGIFPANESSYEDREAALREWEFTVCQTLNAVKCLVKSTFQETTKTMYSL